MNSRPMRHSLHTIILALAICGSALGSSSTNASSQQNFHVKPLKPVAELRREALAAQPPAEQGKRKPDLVEIRKPDPTIKLDIRYASKNNFMGTPFYTQARAFMQR